MALVTFGDVKSDLMEYVDNGLSDPTDARVLRRTNAAMRALARAMPRGVFVGSTAVLQVPVNGSGVFVLPAGYDVALTMESDTETTQLPSGWYDLLSRSAFVNPDDLMGTAFYDLGQDANGIRSYCAPHLPAGVTTLTVSALKAFTPIVDDTTALYVQNVEAIKWYLLSLYKGQRADNLDEAEKYQARAIQELTGELQRHIDDPSLYAARMAQFQFDATNLAAGTLGNVTARMALDFASGQKIGRVDLYRVVNEASRQACQMYNDLGKTEQYSNNAGPESITFAYANNRGDFLSYPDYEALCLLVRAQGPGTTPEQIPVLKDQANKIVARNLATKIIAARNTIWQGLITSNPQPQFGGMRAQLGLELGGGTDGYLMSDRFVSRLVRQAWAQAVDQFNLLSRSEDYEQTALAYPAAVPADSDVVPFPIEVVKLFFEGLVCQDRNEVDRANALKQEGAALLQRNLVSQVERQRRIAAETQVLLNPATFGYHKGRLALELDGGLSMSDAKRGRLINEAEELLSNSGRWKFSETQYVLSVSSAGEIVVPADTESILYAEQCGMPMELKDRNWFYRGCLTRNNNGYGYIGLGGWGWDVSGQGTSLIYGGPDDCGNIHYSIPGCGWGTSATFPAIRALCRRKWVMKQSDSDLMLVQCFPAIKSMAASILARQAGNAGDAEYRKNSALSALDKQLAITMENQDQAPAISVPGLPLGGGRGVIRYRSSWG